MTDRPLPAGRVGRAHGLDGSFHVAGAVSRLLESATHLVVAGQRREVQRRAGTNARPILRLEGICGREQAQALNGQALMVSGEEVPELEPGEYWAHELEGCDVVDGTRHLGVVRRLIALPSCEALEVDTGQGKGLLLPMVRQAIREVDPQRRRIEVNIDFLEQA
jgi:16S rRNA processing protein RimM